MNFVDPTGLWFGADDAVAIGVGAIAGIAVQAVTDQTSRNLSSWESYAGSALGGAATGETMLYTANPLLAGAAGGFASNLSTQGLEGVTGSRSNFDTAGLLISTATGGLIGHYIPSKLFSAYVTGWLSAVSSRIRELATGIGTKTPACP